MAFQTFPIRRQMEEAMSQTTWQKLVGGGDPAVNVIKFQPTKLKSQEKSLADLNSSTICPPLPFSVYKFQYFPQSHPRTISALLFFSFPSLSFILPLLCCMTRLYVTLCLPFSFTTFPFHFLSMAPLSSSMFIAWNIYGSQSLSKNKGEAVELLLDERSKV